MECNKSSATTEEAWLIYEQNKHNYMTTSFEPEKSGFASKYAAQLDGKIILASYYGWLVVANSNDHACISLFDPFTRATVDLPRLEVFLIEIDPRDKESVMFILTCPPDDDNLDMGSCVIMISYEGHLIYCRPGVDDEWSMHPFKIEVNGVMRQTKFLGLAIWKGIIYGLVGGGEFIIQRIHLTTELITNDNDHENDKGPDSKLVVSMECGARFSFTELFDHQSPCIESMLVQTGDDLCWVLVYTGCGDYTRVDRVRVMKFVNMVNGVVDDALDIIEVENLNDGAIFAGTNCSFAVSTPHNVEKNCVYLALNPHVIYVYRLQDHTLATIYLSQSVQMPWDCFLWVKSIAKRRYVDETISCQAKANKGTQLSELPSELVTIMAKCLALPDYSNFRATCKAFCEAAPPLLSWSNTRVKTEFMEATKSSTVLPWLLYVSTDGKLCNVVVPTHMNDQYSMTIPEEYTFNSMDAFYSKDGMLLMYGGSGKMFFYNPFTKSKTDTKHPTNQDCNVIQCVGCSSLPNSPSCTIVGLHDNSEKLLLSAYVYGQDSWRHVPVKGASDTTPFIVGNNSAVFYRNAFYFIDVTGRLATYRVMPNGAYKCKVMKRPTKPACINSSVHITTYLVECCGQLLSVFVDPRSWVKVFRLDFNRRRWVQVDDLGNYMIFLSSSSTFSKLAPTNCPKLGNKIYFPKVHRRGLVCYDIRTCTYCSPMGSQDDDSITDLSQTRDILRCVWIEPQWSLNWPY